MLKAVIVPPSAVTRSVSNATLMKNLLQVDPQENSCIPNEDIHKAATMSPPRRERIRRSRNGISGESDRSSTTTNKQRRTSPTAVDPTAMTESHRRRPGTDRPESRVR
jgi:hypothetical protein